MFCRRAWQRVGPLARRAFKPAPRYAPVRHMAFGVPGGSTNMTYFVLCGGGLTAAVVYAYKTVNGDTERYEERLANVGSTAKAPSETAAPPAAEPAPVEEEAPAAEVIAESAPATAEPVAETSAEPVAEAASEEAEAAVVSEVVVTEAAAESADTEEAAPPAEAQVVLEAAAEAPAEAPVAESTESVPDLFAAVKVLASSTTDIAAASVGENSLVEAVRQIEGEGKGREMLEAESLEAAAEAVAKEASEGAAVVEGEEELKSEEDEEGAGTEDAQTPAAEEVITAGEEEAAAESHPQETTSLTPTVDEPEAEDAAPEEAVSPEDAAPEEAVSSEDAAPTEEATITAEATPVDESSPDEIAPAGEAAAETSAEDTVEAAVGTTQLAAASVGADLELLSPAEAKPTSGSPLHAEKPCHSCHSAPSAGEEVAPPAAVGEELVTDGAVDTSHEAKEAASTQKPKVSNLTVKRCSVM